MRRWGWADFYCGWHYATARALKITALIQDNLHLFLDRLRAQQVVECLTAGHAIAIVVRAAIGAGKQMFDGSLGFGQWLTAEEALASLGEQQAIKMGSHGGECATLQSNIP